ncbi:DsbA family protein [Natronoglycomyces albus]|uniref:Thioredoxin domain-containing protein n=1 Tax=Natronoglycomyces albus TaxID=2811108 RepID=A0A895XIY7_9ACTN|nr:thioredoxin domain-containing protein [Natronoglycomyces albus]QSB04927.1 thioredoxin domain-containing protein [Natronoglycomyces albus]
MGKKSERREAAMAMRKHQEAEARRKKILFGGAIGAAVLLIGGLIVAGIWMNTEDERDVVQPAASHSDDGGLVLGNGETELTVYLDFSCPGCQYFELTYGEQIKEWVNNDQITLNYHPVNFLTRVGDQFSLRAGAASVCAADEGEQEYLDFTLAMFQNQPESASQNVTDSEIITIGEGVGLGQSFADCVNDGRYLGWISEGSQEARDAGIEGTPSVIVNGNTIGNDDVVAEVEAAIAEAGGEEPTDGEDT